MGRVVAVAILLAFLCLALALAASPGDAQSLAPTTATGQIAPPSPCRTISAWRWNRLVRAHRAHLAVSRGLRKKPICIKSYRRYRHDVRKDIRRCNDTPKCYARRKVIARWDDGQWPCLDALWQRESGWRVDADNPSTAYGIPQALPGSKMGPGWRSSHRVQVTWGIHYIAGRYGTPCNADAVQRAKNWY